MKKEIVILANSQRPGGRCVAGICLESGEWIRPIYEDESKQNAISKKEVQHIGLLKIIKINLLENRPETKYQRENYFIDTTKNDNWEIIGTKNLHDIEQFCEQDSQILHSNEEYTEPADMENLEPKEWKSLMLVRKNVEFKNIKIEFPGGFKKKWYGVFNDEPKMELPVTDPYAKHMLYQNPNKRTGNYLMAISLGEPYYKGRCYKFIASVLDFRTQE